MRIIKTTTRKEISKARVVLSDRLRRMSPVPLAGKPQKLREGAPHEPVIIIVD